jgi:hypothetical protein
MGAMALYPIQEPIAHPPQRRNILRQQHQPERQHPNREDRQDAEEGASDEQHADRNPDPAQRWPA